MTKKHISIIFTILIILVSCTKKQTNLEFEKSVAIEIFPILLDSIHIDRRLFPPPPPPPPNFKKIDTIKRESNDSLMIEWDKRKKELKKDTTKLIVAIVDSTYKLEQRAKKEFIQFYKNNSITLDTTFNNNPYKVNLSKLKNNEKIKLIYRSELPKKNVWRPNNYDFYLSGITGFSRIQFDQTKNYGVLNFSFGCGGLCGFSGIALIRKIDEKWIIDKIIVTAVS